jgi:hypothetical protein
VLTVSPASRVVVLNLKERHEHGNRHPDREKAKPSPAASSLASPLGTALTDGPVSPTEWVGAAVGTYATAFGVRNG